jgi:hypothetical protein
MPPLPIPRGHGIAVVIAQSTRHHPRRDHQEMIHRLPQVAFTFSMFFYGLGSVAAGRGGELCFSSIVVGFSLFSRALSDSIESESARGF